MSEIRAFAFGVVERERRIELAEQALRARPDAIGEAREYVRDRIADVLNPPKLYAAELLTSELVTNAVRHANVGEEAETSGPCWPEPNRPVRLLPIVLAGGTPPRRQGGTESVRQPKAGCQRTSPANSAARPSRGRIMKSSSAISKPSGWTPVNGFRSPKREAGSYPNLG
jgi:hypothetical protein